jgi:hypothetical protein
MGTISRPHSSPLAGYTPYRKSVLGHSRPRILDADMAQISPVREIVGAMVVIGDAIIAFYVKLSILKGSYE